MTILGVDSKSYFALLKIVIFLHFIFGKGNIRGRAFYLRLIFVNYTMFLFSDCLWDIRSSDGECGIY